MPKLNDRYLALLAAYPLLTKSVTAGTLAALNETIASAVVGDFKTKSISVAGKKITIKHVFSPKIISMIIYGSLIVTPISHQMYGVINKVFGTGNLTRTKKLLQILTSLCTVTPTLSAVYVSWLSIINNYAIPGFKDVDFKKELGKLASIVKSGLHRSYTGVLKTSLLTSAVSLTVALNFIQPQLWVVFFSVVYFVIGTIQNTRVKLANASIQKEQKEKEEREEKKDI